MVNSDSVNMDYLSTYDVPSTVLAPWRYKKEKKLDFLSNFSVENIDGSKPF